MPTLMRLNLAKIHMVAKPGCSGSSSTLRLNLAKILLVAKHTILSSKRSSVLI